MRRHQQKLILDLLQTIQEAQSSNLYADCQKAVISIINFIDNIVGEGTQTVKLLNKYYELLFGVYNGEINKSILCDYLSMINNSVRNELCPDKIEVVFLSYRASMSDSFESIYFAVKDDPNCDVFFIPIPFYEINPDGNLGQMHYEGPDYYSNNIKITNWQEYDIKNRKPDVIFTHYAYDNYSTNVTIHPDYYSKNLKEYCDILVHIPYFVSVAEKVSENYGYLPGIIYADRVIVQSEAIRNSFIGHYDKFDKEYELDSYFGKAEEKFVAIGSPKFDKVINSIYDNYELPLDWKRLIEKPNSKRKKIILYNTHMFSLLNSDKAYFEKIYSVFDVFKNRDDVLLWWRPHPNIEINIRTQKPEMLEEYLNLVESYKREVWGIYDDTSDLHRAIAVSDAYYGDYSSLLSLYSLTKKPALIQSVYYKSNIRDLNYIKNKFYIMFNDFVIKDGIMWFASWQYNALFSMDLETRMLSYKGNIPGENTFGYYLFSSISINDNYLILTPYNGKNIARYNIKNGEFLTTPIENANLKNFFDSFM